MTDRDSFNNKGYMADSSTSFPMLHSSVLKYFVLLINSEHTADKSLLLFDLMIVSLTYLAKKNFEWRDLQMGTVYQEKFDFGSMGPNLMNFVMLEYSWSKIVVSVSILLGCLSLWAKSKWFIIFTISRICSHAHIQVFQRFQGDMKM